VRISCETVLLLTKEAHPLALAYCRGYLSDLFEVALEHTVICDSVLDSKLKMMAMTAKRLSFERVINLRERLLNLTV